MPGLVARGGGLSDARTCPSSGGSLALEPASDNIIWLVAIDINYRTSIMSHALFPRMAAALLNIAAALIEENGKGGGEGLRQDLVQASSKPLLRTYSCCWNRS